VTAFGCRANATTKVTAKIEHVGYDKLDDGEDNGIKETRITLDHDLLQLASHVEQTMCHEMSPTWMQRWTSSILIL
jgi:hypothetical protein